MAARDCYVICPREACADGDRVLYSGNFKDGPYLVDEGVPGNLITFCEVICAILTPVPR
ncbi:protein of unknown function [Methanoculleus bourgensis]|uniref:Uncharacterized protein n=1 Tax=Methanoculleus bourgensis TaxID=83986 RepID=A0A0X3BJC5_9EURY|nr:protein of unknown function [Methanoculleus bourgensis]